MEAQNKEKTARHQNKIKFSFGNLKIRNKIIFGFFIVSIISGLANYYSNSFIVNEFRAVNNTMHMFHNIFALQKKLEIMVEGYVSSETKESIPDSEFQDIYMEIEKEFGDFMSSGGSFLNEDLTARYTSESASFFEKESDVVEVHKREIAARISMIRLQAEEKEKRYVIRRYVEDLGDGDMYTAFLYSEYVSKEMLYQYKDTEHAKRWIEALDKVKEAAAQRLIDIPGFDDYRDIALKTSEAVVLLESIAREEQKKLDDFRFSIEGLNDIQDELSKELTNQNLSEINTIVLMGVFVFIFILVFFTVLFGYILSSFVSRPIRELSEFALMAAKGNFKRRIGVDTHDEIGQVAEAFNLMLDKVEESTQVLEVKVDARTKRLEELSRNLEAQIDSKTKELNEKINELERFNDLAVGRELRMIELKREMEIIRQGKGSEKEKKKGAEVSGDKIMNCWDFWKCGKEVREKCPAYTTKSGRECWLVSAGKCPRSKERGFEDCKDCGWYKKINNIG
ncbi:MAG: HAMP domain-containing protein [Candidatus Paceibacterota bacterium]|jgi:HAMP domain-containing protein